MIKIICGVYGHYINGKVVAKDKNSEPFSLLPEQEAELVAKGVAAYVEETSEGDSVTSSEEASAPIGFDEMPELPDGVVPIPEYSTDMKADELREIGKLCGLTFKVGMTKAEMVAALDKHIEENTVDGYDEDEEEEDDAPTFDPADAVVE